MPAPKFIQAKFTTLLSPITDSEVSAIVLKKLVDLYGNNLAMSNFGSTGYLTIDPGGDREEIISFTSFTTNDDDTVTINTGITRALVGVSPYGTGGTAYDHPAGTLVVVSNNPQLYDSIIDYVDALSIAGAADASATGKGIVELATSAEIDADDDTGSTGPVVVIPSALAASKYGTRLPTAGEKQALTGTLGTPSTDNLFVTELDASDASTDQSQTTQNSTIEVGEADAASKKNKVAQSFTAAVAKIRGAVLYKSADTGTFTGTVKVAIQADSAGSPAGVDLASFTIPNATWLLVPTGVLEVGFSSDLSLTPGTLYWIVVTPSTSDNSNHINLGTNTAGGYASGSVKTNNTTDGWVAVSTIDLYFKTLNGYTSRVIRTKSTGLPDLVVSPYGFVDLDRSVTTGTTEHTVYTKLLPAGFFNATSGFKIKGWYAGSVKTNYEVTIKVKLNGTAAISIGAIDSGQSTSAGDLSFKGIWEAYVLNNGSLSSQEAVILSQISHTLFIEAGTSAVNVEEGVSTDFATGTSSIDTSGVVVLTVTMTSTNNSSYEGTLLEKIG